MPNIYVFVVALCYSKKKVPLAILRCYKVDNDGTVTNLRRVCPQCGPGVFMAQHFERHYCGKCGLTYRLAGEEKSD